MCLGPMCSACHGANQTEVILTKTSILNRGSNSFKIPRPPRVAEILFDMNAGQVAPPQINKATNENRIVYHKDVFLEKSSAPES